MKNKTNISGFPEWSPSQIKFEKKCKEIIENNFATLGYIPLVTSSVELVSTLTGLGADDKEIYTLSRLNYAGDNEEKKYALHFDLTVPLARYITQRERDLTFPFKRYQIQNSWRGETPAAGRYREFTQCDADIIGRSTLPLSYDAELVYLIDKIFSDLKLGNYIIKISNRKILSGILSNYNIEGEDMKKIIRLIDKKDKMPADKFISELHLSLIDNIECYEIINKLIKNKIDINNITNLIDESLGEIYNEGIRELNEVIETALAYGLRSSNIEIDLSLARGLAYYTGTIIETKLTDYDNLGSVCGGGRYDNLTESFGGPKLPGVGISIGLTRMLGYMFEHDLVNLSSREMAGILIANMGDDYKVEAIRLATELRETNILSHNKIIIENYLLEKKLADQITYALNKNYKYIIILGDEEIMSDKVTIKNLETREQVTIKREEAFSYLI